MSTMMTMMETTRRTMTSLLMVLSLVLTGVECAMTLKPTLDRTSLNYTMIEGKKAILPCKVHDLGTHKVVWSDQWNTVLTFNEQRVIDDTRISVTRPHEEEWNLQFEAVKYGDQGVYVCQVNTDPPLKQSVMLTVVVPPTISSEIPNNMVTVKEGQTAKLTCNASGIPRPTVTWYRQPEFNDPSPRDKSSRGIVLDKIKGIGHAGEMLVIHNVTRHCGGKYNCVADNGVQPKDKKTIQVKVEFVPEVQLANRRMGQSLGKETILECMVSGFPQPHTIWTFQGRQLASINKYKVEIFEHQDVLDTITFSLSIKNISMEDYGIYGCVSTNDQGKASQEMELYQYVEKTRAPPRTTTTTTTTTTTLARHIYPRTFKPDSRTISNTKKNFHKSSGPGGRLGIGNRGRTELVGTKYGPPTHGPHGQSEASIRAGREGNGCRHNPSSIIFTVIALCLPLVWRR